MRSVITGSGIGIPKHAVKNDALARIMDTSDEWIPVSAIDLLLVARRTFESSYRSRRRSSFRRRRCHNIERYGNTTAGTLPILYHELARDGRIRPGQLICFTALGSGLHWGAALYRS